MKIKKLLSFVFVCALVLMPGLNLFNIKTPLAYAATSTSPNLIQNPSVETANGTSPASWLTGFADPTANNALYTYPTSPGFGSNSAVNVKITSYTSGDAKWYFAPVAVTPGQSYVFTDNYLSNTTSELVAEYFDSTQTPLTTGAFDGFISFPASPRPTASSSTDDSSWGSASATFTPPAGAAYMSVLHLINSVGSLTTDNFSLTQVPPPAPFNQGFVTLTFDDGLASQYINALPKLTASGIKSSFYVISHTTPGLSILNQSLEQAGSSGPANWSNTGGTNAIYTYPVPGHTGSAAADVSSTQASSNAGWYFNPINVLNDDIYSFTGWYKSTAGSELVAQITNANGSVTQADMTNTSGNTIGASVALPSSNGTWTQVSANFYVPPNTKAVTVLNRLTGIGSLTVDDYSLGAINRMTADQIKTMLSDGEEIAGHTQSHYQDLTTLPSAGATQEAKGGRDDMLANGITPVLSFAYPYGAYNPSVEQIIQNSGFTSARTVTPGFNGKNTDPFALYAQSVDADTTLATVQGWVTKAITDKTWLILVFHDISTNASNLTSDPYGTTPNNLQAIIDYLKSNNVPTHTMSEGITLLGGGTITPPVTLSSIAITKPATKLSYAIGDPLDLTGLVITGTNSDGTTIVEPITASNVTGFNSSVTATGQILTVAVGGKTTTYAINIGSTTTTGGGGSGGNSGGGGGSHSSSGGYYITRPPTLTTNYLRPFNNILAQRVLGTQSYHFSLTLRRGSRGNEISELEKYLSKKGYYNGKTDGKFGPKVKQAVIKFQVAHKLKGDGVVGSKMRALLNQ